MQKSHGLLRAMVYRHGCFDIIITDFQDFDEPEKKRLLCRLWLAPPNSVPLPESWGDFYRSIQPGTVRGGIRGHNHDEAARGFEARIAAWHGMPAPDYEWGRKRYAPVAAELRTGSRRT